MKKVFGVTAALLLLVFTRGAEPARADSGAYCSAGHHICNYYDILSFPGTPPKIRCCVNHRGWLNGQVELRRDVEDTVEPVPADAKKAECPRGYITPPACYVDDTDFCCRSASALGITTGTCTDGTQSYGGLVASCDDTKSVTPAAYKKTRNFCESTLHIFKNGICERMAASTWALVKNCLGNKGVDTAIGCVPTDSLADFVSYVLKFAFFASGGIILLMGISTGYTLITSQGNAEKLGAAKENLVALFAGLVLIVFSLVLLQSVGADILGLPPFLP